MGFRASYWGLTCLLAVACDDAPPPDSDPSSGYSEDCFSTWSSLSVYPEDAFGMVYIVECYNNSPSGTGYKCGGWETLFDAAGARTDRRHISDCGHFATHAGGHEFRVEESRLCMDPFGRDEGWCNLSQDTIVAIGPHVSGTSIVIAEGDEGRRVDLRDADGQITASVVPESLTGLKDAAWPDAGAAVVVGTSPDVQAVALDTDGTVLWEVGIPGFTSARMVEPGPEGSVYVTGGGKIVRILADGKVDPTFSAELDGPGLMDGLARFDDGICGQATGEIHCFDADGALRFVTELDVGTGARSHIHFPRSYPRTVLRALPDGRLASSFGDRLRVIGLDGTVDWEIELEVEH